MKKKRRKTGKLKSQRREETKKNGGKGDREIRYKKKKPVASRVNETQEENQTTR